MTNHNTALLNACLEPIYSLHPKPFSPVTRTAVPPTPLPLRCRYMYYYQPRLRPSLGYYCRPAYLYRFSRDIPILALNHDFPISCGGVPILEDAGIFSTRRFCFVFFSPVFPKPLRILNLPPVRVLCCRYK